MGFRRLRFVSFLLAAGALLPASAWCFPEMVRHGYVNCTACHVSPSGGGVLTEYGRELSADIASTWGTKDENLPKFALGYVPLPNWLDAMGIYRGVYAYQNTPFIQQGQYIYMQGDGEAAAKVGKFTFDATLGYENKFADTSFVDHVISRRHFVLYQATDNLEARVGRFYPDFGINTPDHVIPTKRDLGWDEGQETYNAEVAWIGDSWNLYATGIFGRPDKPSYHREQGFALTPSIALGDTYKAGLSYEYGNGQGTTRNVGGPWGILGFSKHFFLLTEWDFQRQASKAGTFDPQWGMVNYQRLDYEVIQGLHTYVTQDFSQLNFNDPKALTNSFGAGIQFFPVPHVELNTEWQFLRSMAIGNVYTDFAWLMVNVYL